MKLKTSILNNQTDKHTSQITKFALIEFFFSFISSDDISIHRILKSKKNLFKHYLKERGKKKKQ